MKRPNFLTFCLVALMVCVAAAVPATAQEVMDNSEVITLAKAGLNPTIIIGKIKTSKTNFDLSTDSLIKLKQAGVSDEIVAAMLEAKSGRPIGRPRTPQRVLQEIKRDYAAGGISMRKLAKKHGVSVGTVQSCLAA